MIEQAGGGTDTVQSSVTRTLASNVENLTLTGTNAIDGTGNGLANLIAGNGASNVLTGGSAADTFAFDDAGGADTVADFEDGSDVFDLSAVAGIDDIGDLAITDNGATVTVGYGSGSFTIANLGDPAQLGAADFVF